MPKKMPKNPYPGLRPFEFAENHLFFGREGQSEEILRRLQESRFLAVVGTSGSGKSSLVRAGLLPLLYGGFMTEAGAGWRVAVLRPGDNPIHNLADALVHPTQFASSKTAQAENPVEEENIKLVVAETVLRRSSVGLRDYVDRSEFAPDENLLIVVDQFEELFRFKKENQSKLITEKSETQEKAENEAAAFVKLLLEAVSGKARRVYVVITMRSDFLGDCSQFRDLPETINKGQYLIPRLTTEQLKKAIESPAKVKGARIQPALVARLLNDIGDDQDQLPVLQHALMRTWDKWAEAENKEIEISFDYYNATGGMAAALSNHANEAFDELGDEDSNEPSRKQKIAEKLFKCLTETDRENRRATTIDKICRIADANLEEVITVIEVFRQPGRTFLMPPRPEILDENTLIDISHESLIRKWSRLKIWVEEEARAAQTYRRLAEDALSHKVGEKGFWGDPELKNTLEWKEKFKPNETWSQLYKEKGEKTFRASFDEAMLYLDNSELDRDRKLAREKRQRRLLAALSVLFFFTTLFAGFTAYLAFQSAKNAEEQRAEAESQKTEAGRQKEIAQQEKQNADSQKEIAENERQTAVKERRTAEESKIKTQEALDQQKIFSERAEKAADEANEAKLKAEAEAENARRAESIAKEARTDAENKEKTATATKNREELNRKAMTFLEQNENKNALNGFIGLLAEFNKITEPEDALVKRDGLWWTRHNLGIVYSRLWNSEENSQQKEIYLKKAKDSFDYALEIFGETPVDETLISIATTLRRVAQLYRAEAQNGIKDEKSHKLNLLSLQIYDRLIVILNKEAKNTKSENYPIETYLEKADVQADLNDKENYQEAQNLYEKTERFFGIKRNYVKQIEILKKQSDVAARQNLDEKSLDFLKKVISIQEDETKMNLPFLSPELADSYIKIAFIYNRLAKSIEIESKKPEKSTENSLVEPTPSDDSETLSENKKLVQEYETLSEYYQNLGRLITNANSQIDGQDDLTNIYEAVSNLADAYINIGNCNKAEEIYNEAIQKANRIDKANRMTYELNILSARKNFYLNVRADQTKTKETDEMIFERLKDPSATFLEDYLEFYTFLFSANSYARNLEYERALTLYNSNLKKIESLRNESKKPKDFVRNELYIVTYLAELHDKQDNKTEAENKYEEAVSISEKVGETFDQGGSYIKLADFYLREGNSDFAKIYYEKVINLYKSELNKQNTIPGTYGQKNIRRLKVNFLIKSLYQLGKFVEKENPELARQNYQEAFRLLKLLESENQSANYYRADILESWSKLLEGAEAESIKAQALSARQKEQQLNEEQEKRKKEQEEKLKTDQSEQQKQCKENPE